MLTLPGSYRTAGGPDLTRESQRASRGLTICRDKGLVIGPRSFANQIGRARQRAHAHKTSYRCFGTAAERVWSFVTSDKREFIRNGCAHAPLRSSGGAPSCAS